MLKALGQRLVELIRRGLAGDFARRAAAARFNLKSHRCSKGAYRPCSRPVERSSTSGMPFRVAPSP
jgi:hypothetical protein